MSICLNKTRALMLLYRHIYIHILKWFTFKYIYIKCILISCVYVLYIYMWIYKYMTLNQLLISTFRKNEQSNNFKRRKNESSKNKNNIYNISQQLLEDIYYTTHNMYVCNLKHFLRKYEEENEEVTILN